MNFPMYNPLQLDQMRQKSEVFDGVEATIEEDLWSQFP